MKIAIVIPDILRIHGNRAALSIANLLSRNNSVDVFTHTINSGLEEEVREKVGKSNLIVLERTEKGRYGILFALKYQVLKHIDRALSRAIIERGEKESYDLVLVISNEGRSIGQYLSNTDRKIARITGIVIMELHDHGFHLYHERPLPWLRLFLWPIYPLMHVFERIRFKAYDVVFANSSWTAELFEYLYGLQVSMSLPAVDSNFINNARHFLPDERYIAFPTASLTGNYKEVASRLHNDGVNLITYGPLEIEGIPGRGFIPDEEMFEFLSGASATLFLFNYEALGLIPFESLASGTPVITLPKQGPYVELRENPNVFFTNSYGEIKKMCEDFLSQDKSQETFDNCRESVRKYTDTGLAESIEKFIAGYRPEERMDIVKN